MVLFLALPQEEAYLLKEPQNSHVEKPELKSFSHIMCFLCTKDLLDDFEPQCGIAGLKKED